MLSETACPKLAKAGLPGYIRSTPLGTGLLTILFVAYGVLSSVMAAPAVRLFFDAKQTISPVAIAEDADGLLWIAADEGVFRFDGQHFLRIEGPFEGPAAIEVVGGSTVLIGANNGVFQYLKGTLTRLTREPATALTKLSDDFVLVLHAGTNWMEVASWNGKTTIVYPQRERVGWAWLSSDGTLWQSCGPFVCSLKNDESLRSAAIRGEWKQYQAAHARPLKPLRLSTEPSYFFKSANGFYVFRSPFTGIVSVVPPNGDVRRYTVGEFTRANGRAGLYTDHTGRIWVPGDDVWVTEGSALRKLDLPQLDGIQVYCTFEDTRGRIWLGLKARGLASMGGGPVFERWQTPLSMGEITSLIRENSSTLVATTGKGTILVKREAGDWLPTNLDGNGEQLTQVAPGSGNTLVGARRIGPPARFSLMGRPLREFIRDPQAELGFIRRLVRAPDGSFFMGTSIRAGSLFRLKGDRVQPIEMSIKDGNVQDIAFDRKGAAFVGYAQGVCRVQEDSCSLLIGAAQGLLDPKVRSLGVSAPDEIWVAYRSAEGFSRFRFENASWVTRHFTRQTGYDSPETEFLRRDQRGWVWRGTTNGLWVSDGVHVEPGDWLRISDRDGLPSSAITRAGFLEDADGTVWIGTERGIAHLQPKQSWFDSKENIQITAVRHSGGVLSERSTLPAEFQEPSAFGASFNNFGLRPVQYRLLPLDPGWEVSYTGEMKPRDLPLGHYRLEATAGQGGATSDYAFEVTRAPASRVRFASLVLTPPAMLILLVGVVTWRKRRAAALPPLPDLTQARLAILSPETNELAGKTLDTRFTPQQVIAKGGFGTVFEGRDEKRGKHCAIKIFRREFGDDWLAKRFQQEVAALEAISHPNVVRIYGHGITPNGAPYLVMEFIEGKTLRDLLKERLLVRDVCANLMRQIGNALHEIHSRRIFHRDVKPENMMIRNSALPNENLVLIDFSMAIVKDLDKSIHGLSRAGGTVHYMAPEQAIGYASSEADLYSLAKVAIEMITGNRLVDLLPDAGLDLSQRVRELMSAGTFGLLPGTIEILASALEFDPAHRPRDVRRLTEAIAADLESAH